MTDVTPRPKQGKRPKKQPPAGWWPLDEAAAFVHDRARELCEGDTPACPVGPHRGEHVHHVAGRKGSDPHNPTKLRLLCRLAHDWSHQHPREARRLGLMVSRLAVVVLSGEGS
jgi:hypothetical protein